jgi:hypothetical protein
LFVFFFTINIVTHPLIYYNMAPPSADLDLVSETPIASHPSKSSSASRLSGPLKYSGSLDSYKHFDVTSAIGREYPELQLDEILHDDTKIRDLAILGMSFFGISVIKC